MKKGAKKRSFLSSGFVKQEPRINFLYAGMVELVDSKDLVSFTNRRVGSNPTTRTKLRAFSSVG